MCKHILRDNTGFKIEKQTFSRSRQTRTNIKKYNFFYYQYVTNQRV